MENLIEEVDKEHLSLEKKVRGKYSKSYEGHNLVKAVDDVKNKKNTGYAAAKYHKVPYSTIMNRVYGNASNIYGRVPFLSPEIEKEISQWLIECAEIGGPRTKDELLNGFLERNKGVSFRTPASVTRAAANVSSEEIVKFINSLRSYFDKINPLHLLNDDVMTSDQIMDQYTEANYAKQNKLEEMEEKKKNREEKKQQEEILRNMKKEKKIDNDQKQRQLEVENYSSLSKRTRKSKLSDKVTFNAESC